MCKHWNCNRIPHRMAVSIFRDYCVTLPCWKRDSVCMHVCSNPGVKFCFYLSTFFAMYACVWITNDFAILFCMQSSLNSLRKIKFYELLSITKERKIPARYHLNDMQSSAKKRSCLCTVVQTPKPASFTKLCFHVSFIVDLVLTYGLAFGKHCLHIFY